MHWSDKQKRKNKKNTSKKQLKDKKNAFKNRWTFEEIMYFLFFFNKQTKQCLEIGILQYMWNAVVFLIIFYILIFSNHKFINLLIVIHLSVWVLIISKYALFVFLSELFMKSIYLLSMYQNLCEFAYTVLKRFLFSCEFVHLAFSLHIFFSLSKVWSMLYHGWMRRVQNKVKNTLIYFQVLFCSCCCFS